MKRTEQEKAETMQFLNAVFAAAKSVDEKLLEKNDGDADKALDGFCRLAFGEPTPID